MLAIMTSAETNRIPRFPDDPTEAGIRARREYVERRVEGGAPHLFGEAVDPLTSRGNVENVVGYAQVPVGIAGPLVVHGESGTREVVYPLATNEGAMVAAYSRGMSVLNRAGGVRARVVKDGLTQHPMLEYTGVDGALAAAGAIEALMPRFHELVAARTDHGRLLSAEPEVVGRRVILRLTFATGDAIGINMAANASDAIAELVEAQTSALRRYVHGEDVEKRANAWALASGRGRSVVAEATLPRALVEERLRVSVEDLVRIRRAYDLGFARLGTQNHLVQVANGLAAAFLACGQDVAYLTESATGHLELEPDANGDLWCSASLPNLIVGTVGGGSGKGTARECLELMGCRGTGGARPFAEALGGLVLAGDLSLLASFCSHDFVAAHERLGRNRPS